MLIGLTARCIFAASFASVFKAAQWPTRESNSKVQMNAEWNKSFLSINLDFYPILYVFLPFLLTVQEMTCQSKTTYTLLMYVVLLECVVPLFICPCFFHVHNLRVFMRHEAYINLQAIWNVVYVNNVFNKIHRNACVLCWFWYCWRGSQLRQ